MKAIVPVKASSTRIPRKNFRPFYRGKSLCDLLLEKLLNVMPQDGVYLSCEDAAYEKVAVQFGVRFLLRPKELANNSTPICQVIRGVCEQVPGEDDIMWCQVCNPLFNDYEACLRQWTTLNRDEYDSLVVVHPIRRYLLDPQHQPIGFGFGPKHHISQMLPTMYELPFTLSILTRESIRRTGYYVGERPYWWECHEMCVDIDTKEECELSQWIYAHHRSVGEKGGDMLCRKRS